jgi:TP901 family phage tail tape measure protein
MSITNLAISISIVDLVSQGINKIKNNIETLSKSSKEVSENFRKTTSFLKYGLITGAITKQMIDGLKPAVSLAGDLESELNKVKVELLSGGKSAKQLNEELLKIKSSAFSIQSWTPFDMTQIVALQKELIKAGATVEQVTNKSGAAVAASLLATYENVDPVEAGKALIRIATPFNLTAEQFMELADTISRASSASTADLADIIYSAKYASGVLASLGRSTKELSALSALMAQVGLQGETGGRAIREFFQTLTKYSAFRDANGKLIETTKIIEKLRQIFGQMGEAEKAQKLNKIFGELGSQAAMALINTKGTKYEDIIQAMDTGVSLQEKINYQLSGFKKQLESLKGNFKSTISDIFQPALPVLTSLIKKTNDFISYIGTLNNKSNTLGELTSKGSLVGLGAGTAATAGLLTAGLYFGKKTFSSLGGIKGILKTSTGIAMGKTIESVAGVTPVFVTNWPDNFQRQNTVLNSGGLSNVIKKLPLLAGGKVLAAGAAGYAIGTGINYLIDKSFSYFSGGKTNSLGEWLYDILHQENNIQNNIPIEINIVDDKVITNSKGNTNVSTTVRRGEF